VTHALADQRPYWTGRQVTVALVDSRDEVKWNIDAVDVLIRSNLINLYLYNKYLAAVMESGHNFAMMLIDNCSYVNII